MPAIDTLLASPATTAKIKAATPQKNAGAAENFEHLMIRALAPGEKNADATVVEKTPPKTGAKPSEKKAFQLNGKNWADAPALVTKSPTPAATDLLAAALKPEEKPVADDEKKAALTTSPKLPEDFAPPPVALFLPVDLVLPPAVSVLIPAAGNFKSAGGNSSVTSVPVLMGAVTDSKVLAPLARGELLAEKMPVLAEAIRANATESAAPLNPLSNPPDKISEKSSNPDALNSWKNNWGNNVGTASASSAAAEPVRTLETEKNPTTVTVAPESNAARPEIEIAAANFAASDFAETETTHHASLEPSVNQRKAEVRAVSGAAGSAKNSGTGVASTAPAMKNSDNVDFFTGSGGQKLPVASPTRLATDDLLAAHLDFSTSLPGKISPDVALTYSGADAGGNSFPTTTTTQVNIVVPPLLTEARLKTVEQTHDLVAHHALRVMETKAEAMSLVLKPEAGTELSLELRHRNGMVEASAVLAAGDHQLLNLHWADLQARLELRGIKLGPLGGEGGFNSTNFNSNSGHQQRPPTREEAADHASAFAEFAAVTGGAGARRATDMSGWESWA